MRLVIMLCLAPLLRAPVIEAIERDLVEERWMPFLRSETRELRSQDQFSPRPDSHGDGASDMSERHTS